MKSSKPWAIGVLVITTAFAACAQTTAEHAQHHPEGAATANTRPAPATPERQMSAMDRQLRLMQDMSRKLANARTPQERRALMAEHRKTMQDSMQMMRQMQDMPTPGMGMMGNGMMMKDAGMAGGPASSPSATPGGAARPAPGMGPQMMERMMQRHAMMEKRMEIMQAMMQMMMESMPASPTR
ncbi:hypothetical protein MW7_003410 [Imbroritus primus]|uniref:Uncharacterized protein n=1 Tax=Imbroritus primus TaxID=3058603 RepID=A0ACD3SSQ1_9BURK|nr:hypothetical protein MW7_003410 [Burkholderiaceae bacterium PBA]